MPRTARASVGDVCYHVLNRGNGRARVFHKPEDYARFAELLGQACERVTMRVVGWCVMPNHFHIVLWPHGDGDLGRWMQWLMTAHVRRYHRHYGSSGHVWQGRFKAFPIQEDGHYLTVLRYVEGNALRARIVQRAEDWRWSSLYAREHGEGAGVLSAGPLQRPGNWLTLVNQQMENAQLDSLANSLKRGAPYGGVIWAKRIAARLGLQSALRPLGRPRKDESTARAKRQAK